MSVETYSRYELSPAERERLERERQHRLEEERKRQEEERKRQEEERRQRAIIEQKVRVSYAADYEELAKRLAVATLQDRLTRAQALAFNIGDDATRQKLSNRVAAMLSRAGANAQL